MRRSSVRFRQAAPPGTQLLRLLYLSGALSGRMPLSESLRHGARLGLGRAGQADCLGLPVGGAVGDQAGDGQVGLVEVFAASEEALEDSPLLVLGVRVLDADAL